MSDDDSILNLINWGQPSTEISTTDNNSLDTNRPGVFDAITVEEEWPRNLPGGSSNLVLPPMTETQNPTHSIFNTVSDLNSDLSWEWEHTFHHNPFLDYNPAGASHEFPELHLPTEAPNSMHGFSGAGPEEDAHGDFGTTASNYFPHPDLLCQGRSDLPGAPGSMSSIFEAALDSTHNGTPFARSIITSDGSFINSDIGISDASLAENDNDEGATSLNNTGLDRNEGASVHGARHRRTRFSNSQKDILERWISDHPEPYPTRNEYLELSQKTGLEVRQIRLWFTRTRQRSLRRIDVPSSQGRTRIQQIHDTNSDGNSISRLLDGFVSRKSWPCCASLPIREKSPSSSQLGDQRSHSLPPYHTLRNLHQQLHRKNSKEASSSSIDAVASMADDVELSHIYPSKSTVQQNLQPRLAFSYEQMSPKASFIVEWLEGISPQLRHSRLPVDFADSDEKSQGTEGDTNMNFAIISKEDPFGSRYIKGASDNESIAWSDGRSIASARSCTSHGSRRGRRQKFHPMSSMNSSAHTSRRSSSSQPPFDKDFDRDLKGDGDPRPVKTSHKRRSSSTGGSAFPSKRRHGMDPSRASVAPPSNLLQTPHELDVQYKPYHCTFCPSRFGSKFSWQRHESSKHVIRRVWICRPLAYLMFTSDAESPLCSRHYLSCPHEFDACWKKVEEDRTFYRKDAFKQHLKLVHCKNDPYAKEMLKTRQLDDWSKPV